MGERTPAGGKGEEGEERIKQGGKMTIGLPQVGRDKFKGVDIRIRVRGGGNMSQAYAVRQAIAKGIVAYYREYLPPILMAPAA